PEMLAMFIRRIDIAKVKRISFIKLASTQQFDCNYPKPTLPTLTVKKNRDTRFDYGNNQPTRICFNVRMSKRQTFLFDAQKCSSRHLSNGPSLLCRPGGNHYAGKIELPIVRRPRFPLTAIRRSD